MIQIKIKSDSGFLPEYETEGSAGMDVRAFIKEPIKLKPGERAQVPTGLRIQLKPGYEVQIRARSGLAARNGIGLLNGMGTINSNYRGEIKILLQRADGAARSHSPDPRRGLEEGNNWYELK